MRELKPATPSARGDYAPATHLAGGMALAVFLAFALAYFMSYALRAVGAMIAPELSREFGLSNAALGSMTSAYFLTFAALQLPLGIWLDRFGSRRTHATLLLIASAGCALFALARDVTWLWAGRALMGIGVAGALMSAMKAFRFWYAPERQQQLAAWMLMVGSLGALATTMPVQWALPIVGWRGVFWLGTALLLAASMAVFTVLPRDEERSSRERLRAGSMWSGYTQVFTDPYFWRFGMVSVLSHSMFVSLQSLWAGPWLIQVQGLSIERTSQVLLLFNLVLMASFLGLGWVAPKMSREWSMIRIGAWTTAIVIVVEAAIALLPQVCAWWLWLALAAGSAAFSMLQPHVCLSFPAALTGRAYTAYNLLFFSGTFLWQWLFGVAVDALRAIGVGNVDAFRGALAASVGMQLVGLLVFVRSRARPRATEIAAVPQAGATANAVNVSGGTTDVSTATAAAAAAKDAR